MARSMSERMPEYLFSSIHQAMGAASMAWIPVPSTEVFDSTRAADIALELCRDVADWHEAEVATLTTERDRLREALEEAKKVIGYESQGYGSFPGGDPRNFTPDEEENTPEELAAWKAACEAWDRGEGKDTGPQCQTMGDGSVVTGTGYGMGTYQWPHPAIEYIDAIAEGRALAGTGEAP